MNLGLQKFLLQPNVTEKIARDSQNFTEFMLEAIFTKILYLAH